MSTLKMLKGLLLGMVLSLTIATSANAITVPPNYYDSGSPALLSKSYVFTLLGPGFFDADMTGYSGTFTFVSLASGLEAFLVSPLGAFVEAKGPLTAGTYIANFTGSALSAPFYEISVTAVPEPSTMGMLFAGLGMLGYISIRRRKMD